MTITPERQKWYLKHHGVQCPFCHSYNLDADPMGFDIELQTMEITCLDCGETWVDEYELKGIKEG